MARYSYNPDGTKDLAYICPTCESEDRTLTVTDEGRVLRVDGLGCCLPQCEHEYWAGYHDKAIAEAVADANKAEADGPSGEQLTRHYDQGGPSASYLNAMRRSGRMR
jgi:hypothetical protein